MKEKPTIDTMLASAQPTLSEADRTTMWGKIAAALPTARPIPSPYQFMGVFSSRLAPVALILIVVLGVGSAGTYAAAESAKPGDFLFPIERALEDLRISLASETDAEVLRSEFARKRLLEIQALIDAELARLDADIVATTTASSTGVAVSSATQARITTGIDELLVLMGGLRSVASQDVLFNELRSTVGEVTITGPDKNSYRLNIEGDTTRVEVRQKTDDDNGEEEYRVEIRDGQDRIRIREKDGEVRFDVRKDDDDDDRDDDSKEDRPRSTESTRPIEAVEADVYSDGTRVRVELRQGDDLSFTTTANTRAAVVTEVARRLQVSEAEVSAVLDFEVKATATRSDDNSDDSNDNRDDDRRDESDDDRRDDNTDGETSVSDDDDRDENNDDVDSDNSDIRRIDVEVERTVAQVELEYDNGSKEKFVLTYTTRATLVADLALRLGLSATEVDNLLRLEIDND